MDILKLLKRHPYILLFGIFELFFSAPGQTFLISLFVASIFDALQVSQSLFAGLYSAATLSASLLLNPAGRLIDKYRTEHIVWGNAIFMTVGCFLIAGATDTVILFIGFFLVRLFGQGVFGLTASTLIIKKFHKNRGKAMGIITLGFPLSELIYPSIAILLLGLVDWRMTYVIFGLSNLAFMLPLQQYLIRKGNFHEGEFLPGESYVDPQSLPGKGEVHIRPTEDRDFKLGEALRDIKFYLILASSCIPPTVMTGLLFHQATLFELHGWPIAIAAFGLGVYAVCKAAGSLFIGPVIDRIGPLFPFVILISMLGIGTFVSSLGGPVWVCYLYFGILGTALGFSSPVMNVVWPTFYGVKHMGSIKGFVGTVRNGLTALGPLPLAVALDLGVSLETTLKVIAGIILLMAVLPLVVYKMQRT